MMELHLAQDLQGALWEIPRASPWKLIAAMQRLHSRDFCEAVRLWTWILWTYGSQSKEILVLLRYVFVAGKARYMASFSIMVTAANYMRMWTVLCDVPLLQYVYSVRAVPLVITAQMIRCVETAVDVCTASGTLRWPSVIVSIACYTWLSLSNVPLGHPNYSSPTPDPASGRLSLMPDETSERWYCESRRVWHQAFSRFFRS